MWFMHDGAPAHFSMYAREYLNAVFLPRWSFNHKYATTGSDRSEEVVANPTGQRYFVGLYLSDEATQTTRTNFSEYTLNPPTSLRSFSAEFEYTLYIYIF
jgi:hypothetical protein